jgi:transcriptional regulator with PAS, ATPase and Fis domain
MATKLTLSEKVLIALHRENKSKSWLAEQLGVSRMTLHLRLKTNDWLVCEVVKIDKLLKIAE